MLPVLGALALAGQATLFLGALMLSLASDVVDGYLARKSGVTSEVGAKLDSWGDLATYASLPLLAWWLWPDLLLAEVRYLACAIFASTLPSGVGRIRFGRLTSYHSWAAKGTAVLVVEAIEEIAISCVLPRWKSDVRSLWHAMNARNQSSPWSPARSSGSSFAFTVRRSRPSRRAASS